MDKRYSIGQFAALSNILATTLRYYDEEGLLRPAYRDPKTGYRYYGDEQLLEALTIKELRSFGFSIPDILDIQKQSSNQFLEKKLEERLEKFDKEIFSLQRRKETAKFAFQRLRSSRLNLENRNSDAGYVENDGTYPVEIYDFPEKWVISRRYRSGEGEDRKSVV